MIDKMEGTIAVIAVALLAAAGIWLYRQAPSAAQVAAAAQKINPLNPDNVFATSVNALGSTMTGIPDWSLGTAAFDLFNPGAVAAEKALTSPVATKPAAPAPLSGWDQYGVPTF